MKTLDVTWWRSTPGGYEQQDGYGRLVRLKTRTKVTGWGLYINGEYRGSWPKLAQAKRRAKELTSPDTVSDEKLRTLDECRAAGTHMIRCTGDGACKVCFETDPPDPLQWRRAMDALK